MFIIYIKERKAVVTHTHSTQKYITYIHDYSHIQIYHIFYHKIISTCTSVTHYSNAS